MAVGGRFSRERMLVINIYAPHQRARREEYFTSLLAVAIPAGAMVTVGGDFNCTFDAAVDRSYVTKRALMILRRCEVWCRLGALTPR